MERQALSLFGNGCTSHNLAQYISKVTAEKPRARCYIDDKGLRFTDWENMLKDLEEYDILEKEDL